LVRAKPDSVYRFLPLTGTFAIVDPLGNPLKEAAYGERSCSDHLQWPCPIDFARSVRRGSESGQGCHEPSPSFFANAEIRVFPLAEWMEVVACRATVRVDWRSSRAVDSDDGWLKIAVGVKDMFTGL
jgi:hypothetical protein